MGVARQGYSQVLPPQLSGNTREIHAGEPPSAPLVLCKSAAIAAPNTSGFGPMAVRNVTPMKPGTASLGLIASDPPNISLTALSHHVYHDAGSSLQAFGITGALSLAVTHRYRQKYSTTLYIVPGSLAPAEAGTVNL